MNTTSFTFFTKVQDVKIIPSEIIGNYDGLKSFLNISIHFTFRPPTREIRFDVVSLIAKLKLENPNVLLSQVQIMPAINVKMDSDTSELFIFTIDEETINIIEKNRNGDINFFIELTALISAFKEVNAGGYIVNSAHGTLKDIAKLHFSIPKSIWVEKILPTLGYQSLKLIEIPLTHRSLKEAYADIIFEFNNAEYYFNQQDYNKCVAHCRSTQDALNRNLKKIKENTESETAFKWLKSIDEATFNWIDALDKANSAIGSKTHHAGLKRDFTRHEAESIYLVTLGLLNFIGHLK